LKSPSPLEGEGREGGSCRTRSILRSTNNDALDNIDDMMLAVLAPLCGR